MGRDVKKEEMEEEGIERMIERLCQLPDLYLPHSLAQRSEPMSQGEKQSHLRSLVRRDAAIFLGTQFCIHFLLLTKTLEGRLCFSADVCNPNL
jgi:hypothetical protein